MQNPQTKQEFFRAVLATLNSYQLPFLVGGTYAFTHYTDIHRPAQDLDLFCRPNDLNMILDVMEAEGFTTERKFPWWLAKIHDKDSYADIIYNHGNGLMPVDDLWFEHAEKGNIFDHEVLLMPPEEIIWTKAFIQTRERFDGPDVYHLILRRGKQLRWEHLYKRMEHHWQILFAHLINFTYIYPSKRSLIPEWLMGELLSKFEEQRVSPDSKAPICRGAYLSIGTDYSDSQYRPDLTKWGFKDPRPSHKRPLNLQPPLIY